MTLPNPLTCGHGDREMYSFLHGPIRIHVIVITCHKFRILLYEIKFNRIQGIYRYARNDFRGFHAVTSSTESSGNFVVPFFPLDLHFSWKQLNSV